MVDGHSQNAIVQSLDGHVLTVERVGERDCQIVDEVVALPLVDLVRQLHYLENEVRCHPVDVVMALPWKNDLALAAIPRPNFQ